MAIFAKDTAYVNLDDQVAPYYIGTDDLPPTVVLDAGTSNKTVVLKNPVCPGQKQEIIAISPTFSIDIEENVEGGSIILTLDSSLTSIRLVSDVNSSQWIIY